LLSAAVAAAMSFAFALVSAPEPRSSQATEANELAAPDRDLLARLDALSERLDRLETRSDVLSTPLSSPSSPRTELDATPPAPSEEPTCDAHCVVIRQQIDAVTRRLEMLENHLRYGGALPEAKAEANQGKRSWGPEQATGAPDSQSGSDQSTAWASATEDDQDEWLVLSYEHEVAATGVKVYETYKPGALSRVTIFTADGSEVEVWRGQDPTSADQAGGVSSISFPGRYWTDRVKLYLNSRGVKGWNEIDAVALIDDGGRTSWAATADASSTYASRSQTASVSFRQGRVLQFNEGTAIRLQMLESFRAATTTDPNEQH
jgi:hypothetical protein